MAHDSLSQAALARIRDRMDKANERPEQVREWALNALQERKLSWECIRGEATINLISWARDLLSIVLEEWASIGIPSADFKFQAMRQLRNVLIHVRSRCVFFVREDYRLCPSTLFLAARIYLLTLVYEYSEKNRFRFESQSVVPSASVMEPVSQASRTMLPLVKRLSATALKRIEAETDGFIADHFSDRIDEGNGFAMEGDVGKLVLHHYDLLARECISVCVSTMEFESALYAEILEFALVALSDRPLLTQPVRIALEQATATLVRGECPWNTASGASSVRDLARIVEAADEAILKWVSYVRNGSQNSPLGLPSQTPISRPAMSSRGASDGVNSGSKVLEQASGENREPAITNIGTALRRARHQAKLSRVGVAKRLKGKGVPLTPDAIKKHEEGTAVPRPEARRAYAELYGTTEDFLFPSLSPENRDPVGGAQ